MSVVRPQRAISATPGVPPSSWLKTTEYRSQRERAFGRLFDVHQQRQIAGRADRVRPQPERRCMYECLRTLVV